MDEKTLKKGYRAGWILVLVAAFHIVAFWMLNFYFNGETRASGWDLGREPIVPASSVEADGYYHEVDQDYGK